MRAKNPPGQISDQEQPWRIRNFGTVDSDGATFRMITPQAVPIASKRDQKNPHFACKADRPLSELDFCVTDVTCWTAETRCRTSCLLPPGIGCTSFCAIRHRPLGQGEGCSFWA